tara:strand:- start:13755 stop:14513 length:759 start_codon:yes stop_codon:yes gene_type:complete
MYEITINHKNVGKKTYTIYTKNEADKEKLPYSHWKDAREGEWALSDDGFVSKIITKKSYSSQNEVDNVYLRFAWGYHFFSPKYEGKELNVKGRKSNTTLSGKRPIEVKAKQEKMKNLAMVYAQTMNTGDTIKKVCGELDSGQERRIKRYMRTEVFKGMVREELTKLLSDHGLTEHYTLDLLEQSIVMAKDKKDITNLIRVVENLQDMHGMKDKHLVKTTDRIEATSTTKLIDEIREEENKLMAQRTTVSEEE